MSEPIIRKSGFAVLMGRSNVGKSSLLNTLVGTKIAAVTSKPQTTRDAIHGVVHDPVRGQIVFVDTPGILKERHSVLSGLLQTRVQEALEGVDCILYVVDPTRDIGDEERYTLALIRKLTIPKILVINKIDDPDKPYLAEYRFLKEDEHFDQVIEISALRARHIESLKDLVFQYMEPTPEEAMPYPESQHTNVNHHFFISEIIREKVFLTTEKEVPYSVMVHVDNVEEKDTLLVIAARIITTADRYKKMIIGQGGSKIKEIGTLARKELEQATNRKVFLELQVETNAKWETQFEV
ncbi:MAG: GTPase Era [Patescibacteria group bacterium]